MHMFHDTLVSFAERRIITMNKKSQIQQLVNSRKLSTDEEYVLFESALQALQMSITIDVKNDNPKKFGDKIDMLIERVA